MTGKNRVVLSVFLALGLISTNANAADPCKSVFCLYGKAVGRSGGGECSSAEKDFFNKIEKRKGKIRWSKTVDLRKNFLNQCSTADPAAISLIMSKFGRVRG
ncbi:TrbM/KikA/MpfK family conjugal transfer protein [Escherichia coli]|uniref:TrbM/KikA/MpfK family conjugal transfer protein n=1 Tax=Escherichia coli TaxID=562 RepID=UPI0009522216|nr:TrbM/KikA/MpfK family conjugal transfer protein [Escherichia coli]EAS2965989.1 conjugal transfer protein [Salmonella enterica]EGC6482343.1 conjugal transfer protein [Salmonella enterica subsp. enterica serovar Typhimurium]EGS9704756.1 conjugal transfer protein [Salmonella enterica subsp. enterica serovar Ohio]EHF5861097.1 conjugal transfer protein [Salmonella enterica subsp. enterica serovar Infantis]EIP3410102.1 conjugal transfer protein [Salmonella enterica subsp. enterica serovar Anatum]